MTAQPPMSGTPILRAVGAAALEPGALADEILAVVSAAPGGLTVRSLPTALAERLATAPADLPARSIEVALGLLIAGGRVDERAGRLVPTGEEQRRAV